MLNFTGITTDRKQSQYICES